MKLTAKTITTLTLAPGENDRIWFCEELPRFGYRLRRSHEGAKVRASWLVQYKKAGRSPRIKLGDGGALGAEPARAAAKKVLARVDLGEDPASDRRDRREKDRLSLRSVIDEYLETRRPPQTDREGKDKSRVRPKTYRELRRYLLDTFRPLHSTPVDGVTRKDIAFHLARLRRERGVSVESCARAALNKFFSWAMTMGLVEHNPVIGTPQPSRVEPRSRVLSDSELAAIWHACQDDDYGHIIRLLILLGARRQDLPDAPWTPVVRRVFMDGRRLSSPHKTGRPVALPVACRRHRGDSRAMVQGQGSCGRRHRGPCRACAAVSDGVGSGRARAELAAAAL